MQEKTPDKEGCTRTHTHMYVHVYIDLDSGMYNKYMYVILDSTTLVYNLCHCLQILVLLKNSPGYKYIIAIVTNS